MTAFKSIKPRARAAIARFRDGFYSPLYIRIHFSTDYRIFNLIRP